MDREELERVEQHLFARDYMSGVERDKARIKSSGEVFTPKELVDRILKEMDKSILCDPNKKIVDPTCGDGEFLAGILYLRLENEICLEKALETLFGVDKMEDNVKECRRRLACGSKEERIKQILKRNIVCKDALEWFNGEKPQGEFQFYSSIESKKS